MDAIRVKLAELASAIIAYIVGLTAFQTLDFIFAKQARSIACLTDVSENSIKLIEVAVRASFKALTGKIEVAVSASRTFGLVASRATSGADNTLEIELVKSSRTEKLALACQFVFEEASVANATTCDGGV